VEESVVSSEVLRLGDSESIARVDELVTSTDLVIREDSQSFGVVEKPVIFSGVLRLDDSESIARVDEFVTSTTALRIADSKSFE
jgi:hypothetical protein